MKRLIVACLVCVSVICATSSTAVARYTAPRRSVSTVAWAIARDPGSNVSRATRTAWAKVLVEESKSHNFDALTYVALITYESHWNPSATNGEDYGLAQIRARHVGACRDDDDPVHNPSKACLAVKSRLMDPAANIRMMAAHLENWRRLCLDKTGRAQLRHTLAGYGGLSTQGRMCGQRKVKGKWVDTKTHPLVARIVKLRRSLLRQRARGSASR